MYIEVHAAMHHCSRQLEYGFHPNQVPLLAMATQHANGRNYAFFWWAIRIIDLISSGLTYSILLVTISFDDTFVVFSIDIVHVSN